MSIFFAYKKIFYKLFLLIRKKCGGCQDLNCGFKRIDMQVLPSTAADKRINIKNIHKLENNIHAGTYYAERPQGNSREDSDWCK